MTVPVALEGAVDTRTTFTGPDQLMWIDGKRVESSSGQWRPVMNPAHRDTVITRVPAAGVDDVNRAVVSAKAAFPAWRSVHFTERARALSLIADEIEARADDFARLTALDTGNAVRTQARPEVVSLVSLFRYLAGVAGEVKGVTLPAGDSQLQYTRREPLGVVACILPWNSPLMIAGFAMPFLGEKLDLPRSLAILAGLVGVAVALRPGSTPLELGHLAAIASACLGACNYIVIRKTGGVERPGVLLLYPMAVQVLAVGIAMLWLWRPMTGAAVGMTFLMALQLVFGGLLILGAYRRAPVIVVAPMQYSQIIWAAALGWAVFGERIDGPTALGIGIIIAAGLFLLARSAAPQAGAKPEAGVA